jgi:hypothetical protein
MSIRICPSAFVSLILLQHFPLVSTLRHAPPNSGRFLVYIPILIFCRFNRKLIRLRGLYLGIEHGGESVNVSLGPMINMARVAQTGRNSEGFGEDAFF